MAQTKRTFTTTNKVQSKNRRLITTSLVGKDEVFKMLALGETTNLPILLVGNPGVSKTKCVLEYAKGWLFKDGDVTDEAAMQKAELDFMNKVFILETDEGTKSSEVKGMPDLEKLFTENKFEHLAPIAEAEVIVINEIDKASANIRNALLGIMNERFLFAGKHKIPCKWKLFVGTCNQIPKDEIGSPFWDRFVIKHPVARVSAQDLLNYFNQGDKKFRKQLNICVPTKDEIENVSIGANKMEKYLEIAYNRCTDRTLTYTPLLTKAASQIWESPVDAALIKVASIMLDSASATALASKLVTPEMKNLLSKVDMLRSMKSKEQLMTALDNIGGMLSEYSSQGKMNKFDAAEIEDSIASILDRHPVKMDQNDLMTDVGFLKQAQTADLP